MKRSGVARKNVLPFVVAAVLAQGPAFAGTSGFDPTFANTDRPPGKAPEGMVWIPGGEFSMGAAVNGEGSHEMPMASNDSGPIHRVRVDGFGMDATAVTNVVPVGNGWRTHGRENFPSKTRAKMAMPASRR
jgi:formylglycine-generating enzyme required for sulfatase activity